jgi:hypothetical protein
MLPCSIECGHKLGGQLLPIPEVWLPFHSRLLLNLNRVIILEEKVMPWTLTLSDMSSKLEDGILGDVPQWNIVSLPHSSRGALTKPYRTLQGMLNLEVACNKVAEFFA